MAITGGDWSSSTDPFILATAHVSTFASASAGEIAINSEGFLNGIVDDKDIQELFWSKDGAPDVTWPVVSARTNQRSSNDWREFGYFDEDRGLGFRSWVQYDLVNPSPGGLWVSFLGKTTGAVPYSLFAFTAYAWREKDPAQIFFSWVAHHVDSIWTLKDYLDQTSFQDASDHYDENPCPLTLYREVGSSIDQQIKKVMDHTSDFLVIAPQDTTGDVLLAVKPRRSGLASRDYAIDLESESIRDYTIRPTDRYTLDKIASSFGPIVMMDDLGFVATQDSWILPPIEFPSENRNNVVQKVGSVTADRTVTADCPYHIRRRHILSHLDIGFWKDDQDELEVEFADQTHFNFEAGDIVPVTGRGYGGTELFIVTEKTTDWDTGLATCRLLMIQGIEGKSPVYADQLNHLLSLRPNSLGLFFDGDVPAPAIIPLADWSRNFDRIWDEAGYGHPTKHTRGTVGPGSTPPTQWPLVADKRERWPGFELATDTGLEISLNVLEGRDALTSAASNYTFYWVGNPTSTSFYSVFLDSDDGAANQVIFAQTGLGGAVDKVQFFDGAWQGTQASTTGWQILVFILDSTGSTIRRNGADIETGLAYTQQPMANSYDVGVGVTAAGAQGVFTGDWTECALFSASHDATTVGLIEAHLAEKYNITI